MILFPFSLQDPIAAAALFWARALCVQAWSLHPRENKKEMGKWEIPESGFVSCKKKKQNPFLFRKEKNGKHGKFRMWSWVGLFLPGKKERNPLKPFLVGLMRTTRSLFSLWAWLSLRCLQRRSDWLEDNLRNWDVGLAQIEDVWTQSCGMRVLDLWFHYLQSVAVLSTFPKGTLSR